MRPNEIKIKVLGSGYTAIQLPDEVLDLVQETYEDTDRDTFSVAIEASRLNDFITEMARITGYVFNTVSSNHETRTTTIRQSNTEYVEPTPRDQQEEDEAPEDGGEVQTHQGHNIRFRNVARDGNSDRFFSSPVFRGVNEDIRLDEPATRRRIHRMSSAQADMNVDEVEQIIAEITSLSDKLIRKQRKLNRLQADINDNPMVSELYQQAETLRNTTNNKVSDVFFTENHLVIRTEELQAYCESDGLHRQIGSMEFLISLEALIREEFETRFIVVRNRTRELIIGDGRARQAPHVGSGGNACFGNITSTIIELMARRDLIAIVDNLIRYIETPNESDSLGRYAKYWPVAPQAAGNRTAEHEREVENAG